MVPVYSAATKIENPLGWPCSSASIALSGYVRFDPFSGWFGTGHRRILIRAALSGRSSMGADASVTANREGIGNA